MGTALKLVNQVGQVVWSADYDSFGNAEVTVEAVKNPLRRSGQYFDEETGLHNNWQRYYSGSLGRYLSQDPARAGGNWYVYAYNSPSNFIDPTGEIPPLLAIAAILVVVDVALTIWDAYELIKLLRSECSWQEKALGVALFAVGFVPFVPPGFMLRAAGRYIGDLFTIVKRGFQRMMDWIGLYLVKKVADVAVEAVARFFRKECFVAGTLVYTEHGLAEIEEIDPGERVWSYDFSEEEWELQRVSRTLVHKYVGQAIRIAIAGSVIISTVGHPIFVANVDANDSRPVAIEVPIDDHGAAVNSGGRWIEAGLVEVGDVILTKDGKSLVSSVEEFEFNGFVYNIQVEETANYSVGLEGILVHNKAALNKDYKVNPDGTFSQKTTKYSRNMEERKKALLRDAEDPNSGLTQE